MANPNFKGRPVGTGKTTFIEDPLLGDFKIVMDEYSFTVIDTARNKTMGYYSSLPEAILRVARYSMLEDKSYSLKEYAEQFKQTHLKLKEAILK
jgi:hypothetical protein